MIANMEAYKTIREVASEQTDLSEEDLAWLLDARKIMEVGFSAE